MRLSGLWAVILGTFIASSVPLAWSQTGPSIWLNDLETARRIAAETNRLVLIHFWAEWCRPCRQMEAEVFSRPEVLSAIATSYVAVKVNFDQNPVLVRQLNVTSVPTDIIMTAQGEILNKSVGGMSAPRFIERLNEVAASWQQRQALLARMSPPPAGPFGQSLSPGVSPDSMPTPMPVSPPIGSPAGAWSQGGQPPSLNSPPAVSSPVGPLANPVPSIAGIGASASPLGSQPPMSQSPPMPSSPLGAWGATNYQPPSSAPSSPWGVQTSPQTAQAPPSWSPTMPPAATSSSPPSMPAPASELAAGPVPDYRANTFNSAPNATGNPYESGAAWGNSAAMSPQPSTPTMSENVLGSAPVTSPTFTADTNMATTPSPETRRPAVDIPPGNPPLGLEGYCPVSLTDKQRWVLGNRRWGVRHEGRTYLFAGPEEQQKFLANPDRYAPVLSGYDPVRLVENTQLAEGRREHGAWFGGRVYLFADEESFQKFSADPYRYINALPDAVARLQTQLGAGTLAGSPSPPGGTPLAGPSAPRGPVFGAPAPAVGAPGIEERAQPPMSSPNLSSQPMSGPVFPPPSSAPTNPTGYVAPSSRATLTATTPERGPQIQVGLPDRVMNNLPARVVAPAASTAPLATRPQIPYSASPGTSPTPGYPMR